MTIIAEIGQNHMGKMGLAMRLIQFAKANGADLAKFQLYSHEKLYKEHPEIPNVELSFDQAKMLFDYGTEMGIEVFFSVFDTERIEWCEEIGVKRYKLAFSQRDNAELIKVIRHTHKQLIISDNSRGAFTTLYCVPQYPASVHDYKVNNWMSCHGISDHTIGSGLAKIALSYGMIIEKHFAIDHKTGVDAKWSMTPMELKELKRFESICKQVL